VLVLNENAEVACFLKIPLMADPGRRGVSAGDALANAPRLFSHSPHLVREDVDHLQGKIVSTTQQRNEAFSVNHCEFGVLHGLCCQTVGLIGKGGWQPEDVARAHDPVGEFFVGAMQREPHSPFAHDEDATRLLSLAEENCPSSTYNCGRYLFEGREELQLHLRYFGRLWLIAQL